MLTGCQFVNFKSWEDTGQIRLAPLTVFFGRNSSGKSSLLQAGLMMKRASPAVIVSATVRLSANIRSLSRPAPAQHPGYDEASDDVSPGSASGMAF